MNGIHHMSYSHPQKVSSSDWQIARWMLIIRPTVVTATLGVFILMLRKEMIDITPIGVVVVGTYVLTLLYWFAYYVSGISRALLATQISFDIFIITVIIHYTEGADSSFVGFYFLSIMCASLFFKRIITFLFSTQAVLFYVLYLFVFNPFLESSSAPVDMRVVLQALLYSILMYTVGFFSSYYAENLRGKNTALINALKLLKEAKLDTFDILQSMANGLITVDMAGRVMYMNRVAEEVLQVDCGFAVGESVDAVFGGRAQELVNVFKHQFIKTSPDSEKEITIFDKEGSAIPLGLTSMPLYDTDGSRRGVIVNFKDLTEKKKLLEMIRQSERMAAIGELSSAIAHEIRNPLASICNAAEILSENYGKKDSQVMKLIYVIEKESERLQRISSEFLTFARMTTPDIKPIYLKKVLDDVLTLIENDPRKTENIIIRNYIDENKKVLFDSDNLQQLIINVIINSLEALKGKGIITINAEDHEKPFDNYIRVVFSDNGPGFPEEALGHMFEPFFSTKKGGTGLGLALVRKIAISNHGRVFARNRKSGGAEVTLDLPVSGVE